MNPAAIQLAMDSADAIKIGLHAAEASRVQPVAIDVEPHAIQPDSDGAEATPVHPGAIQVAPHANQLESDAAEAIQVEPLAIQLQCDAVQSLFQVLTVTLADSVLPSCLQIYTQLCCLFDWVVL